MHIQLTKVLLAQALLPLVFLLAPIFLIFGSWLLSGEGGSPLLHAKHNGLLLEIFTSLIAVADPLVTILIIPGYRRALMKVILQALPCNGCFTPATNAWPHTLYYSLEGLKLAD